MSRELEPCPECGTNDVFMDGLDGNYVPSHRIACRKCPPLDQWFDTEDEAIEEWNKRRNWRALAQEAGAALVSTVSYREWMLPSAAGRADKALEALRAAGLLEEEPCQN